MDDNVEALLHDLLSSLNAGERPYGDMMAAWRTSCPRLPVWEEANDRGLVARISANGQAMVAITPRGRAFLESNA